MRVGSNFTQEQIASIKHTLLMADLVKFAKENPTPPQNEKSLVICKSFINECHEKIESQKAANPTQESNG